MVKAITKETAIKEPSPRGPSKNKKIPGNSLKMAHKHIKKQDFNKLGLWAALARLDAATTIKTHAAIFKKPPPNVGIQPSNFQPSNVSKTKETMVMIQPSNVPKTKETMAMILLRWMWFEVFINQNHSKVCKFDTFLMWKVCDFFCFCGCEALANQPFKPSDCLCIFSTTMSKISPKEAAYSRTCHGSLV